MPTTPSTRIRLWPWIIAALAAVAVLLIAIAGRADGATLQAMSASEDMTDEQARGVADNTVRVWVRERNAGNVANLKALSCPDTDNGALRREIDSAEQGDRSNPPHIAATGSFTRNADQWALVTMFDDGGAYFTLRVTDGRLLVCQIDSAPIP